MPVCVRRFDGYVYTYRIHQDETGSWAAEVRHFIFLYFAFIFIFVVVVVASFVAVTKKKTQPGEQLHIRLALVERLLV